MTFTASPLTQSKPISSPASAGGRTLSGSPGGLMIDPCGPGRVPASRSPVPGVNEDSTTIDTFGPSGSVSSASTDLQSFLASKLQTLMASSGSTLFRLTWKERITPLLRPICARRASARRTSDSDSSSSESTSWPSPTCNDAKGSAYTYANGDHDRPSLKLVGAARLATSSTMAPAASWPTPNASVERGGQAKRADGTRSNLIDSVMLTNWPTPQAGQAKAGFAEAPERTSTGNRRGHQGNEMLRQARLAEPSTSFAGWPTARATDGTKGVRTGDGSKTEQDRNTGVRGSDLSDDRLAGSGLGDAAPGTGMGDAGRSGLAGRSSEPGDDGQERETSERAGDDARTIVCVDNADGSGRIERNFGALERELDAGRSSFWANAEWLYCRDGKYRPVEPGTFPMVDGSAFRVGSGSPFEGKVRAGMLKGYGNAIVPQTAAVFIRAVMDYLRLAGGAI